MMAELAESEPAYSLLLEKKEFYILGDCVIVFGFRKEKLKI